MKTRAWMVALFISILAVTSMRVTGQAPATRRPALPPTTMIPERGRGFVSSATGMEFVWIEALGIWVGKYEVTNQEYRKKVPTHSSGAARRHSRSLLVDGNRHPVVRVNFDDAKRFAEWMTENERFFRQRGFRYRLPGEQEWMVFAQCGDEREFPWGPRWPPPQGRAGNYLGKEALGHGRDGIDGYRDGHRATGPVDELWANPWGLHGVGGNVWEACAADETGESFGAWRGGSWRSDRPETMRISARRDVASRLEDDCGFRLVISPIAIESGRSKLTPDAKTWQDEWTIIVNAVEGNLHKPGHHPMGWIPGELGPSFVNRPNYEGPGKRTGLLALHPLSRYEPARIRYNGDVSPAAPVLVVEASGNVHGDSLLQCVVNGDKIGEVIIDGSQWTTAEFDLSRFAGTEVVLELRNAAGGTKPWSFEHCYIDKIYFRRKAQ